MEWTQILLGSIRHKGHLLIQNKELRNFFNNLGVVFIFRFITAALNMITMVLIARHLGVVAMGDITVIQNTAFFLVIPIVFGINTSIIKYLPQSQNDEDQVIIGSALVCNLVLTTIFVIIYAVFSGAISRALGISPNMWLLSIVLAVTINGYTILETILRARSQFLSLGIIKLIASFVFFAVILISISMSRNIHYAIAGLVINQVVFCLLAFKKVGLKKIRFSLETTKLIYTYGGINMVSWTLSYLLFSTDLYIVKYFCSAYDVGIFSVYQINVRNFFNIMFHEVFAAVFLPTIVQMDKLKIYRRVISLIPLLLPLAVLTTFFLGSALLFMYGKDYGFNWVYLLIVSTGIGFHFIYWVLNSVFTVEGKKGAILCLKVLGIPIPILFAASIFLTKAFGILGAMISWLITQLVLIGVFLLIINITYLKKSNTSRKG